MAGLAGSAGWAGSDRVKTAFFALVALCILVVAVVDERFLFFRQDPEWKHIARYELPLLIHGPLGAVALLLGPLQFSDRLRRARPNIHRWIGRVYVGAIAVAAPVAIYIGVVYERPEIHVEQVFQGGLWLFTTLAALACILTRRIAAHKLWMMRSYGLCLVFVTSRLPDAVPGFKWTGQLIADVLWGLVIAALVLPDVILALREPKGPGRRAPRTASA